MLNTPVPYDLDSLWSHVIRRSLARLAALMVPTYSYGIPSVSLKLAIRRRALSSCPNFAILRIAFLSLIARHSTSSIPHSVS